MIEKNKKDFLAYLRNGGILSGKNRISLVLRLSFSTQSYQYVVCKASGFGMGSFSVRVGRRMVCNVLRTLFQRDDLYNFDVEVLSYKECQEDL